MAQGPPEQGDSRSLRDVLENFIQSQRLGPKLEEIDKGIAKDKEEGKPVLELEDKRRELVVEHERERWIEGAAKRAWQIKLATHAPKFMHPDAKGTSVYLYKPKEDAGEGWVSTAGLGGERVDDVVGNAAALDVYKLLKLEHKGETVLQRAERCCDELAAAMSDDKEKASAWMKDLVRTMSSGEDVESHRLAKQIYFPLTDGEYHLLAPLFPSSLVHALHVRLQDAQFSDEAKAARKARKDGKYCDHGYQDYPNLAVQAFGGTKPQNVSLLNSVRRGEAWLLPSFPPAWRTDPARAPLGVDTVFRRWFGGRRRVRELTKSLAEFLASTDYNNVSIRRTRAAMVDAVVDEFVQFTAELHELQPGWSADAACKLNSEEALWLDPGRAPDDSVFASGLQSSEWQQKVAARFANWLNAALRFHSKKKGELPLGDAEHRAWQDLAEQALKMLSTEGT